MGAPLWPPKTAWRLLAVLAADSDAGVSKPRTRILLAEPSSTCRERRRPARIRDPRLFAFCSRYLGDKPGIADALAKNPACPPTHVGRGGGAP